ncbi:MAG: serine hydrolase domain-containing protein [Ferruginibacter sp.]
MTYKWNKNCLSYSFLLMMLLFFQTSFAQYNFSPVEDWVHSNLKDLGGRAVVMVYKDGKVIYNESFNEMTRRQKMGVKLIARKTGKDAASLTKDYDENSKISLASCSKWLSAALVMTFVDDGKLQLTDTVGKFLPVMTANGKGAVTISQCLSHTTGIKGGSVKESKEWMNKIGSMDEAVALIAKQPVESAPGQSFHYSSVGLQLAGAVIEKISGKSFETLFAERIARPCNMHNTDFGKKKTALPAGSAQAPPAITSTFYK